MKSELSHKADLLKIHHIFNEIQIAFLSLIKQSDYVRFIQNRKPNEEKA